MPRKLRAKRRKHGPKQNIEDKNEEEKPYSLTLATDDTDSLPKCPDTTPSDPIADPEVLEGNGENDEVTRTPNESPTTQSEAKEREAFWPFYESYDTPCDLSLKNKRSEDESNNQEEECDRSESKIEMEAIEESGLTPQQLLLAHLSKVQHHLLTNFFQYQAAFLNHFQHIQHQILSKEQSNSSLPNLDEIQKPSPNAKKEIDTDDENATQNTDSPGIAPHILLNILAAQNIYGSVGTIPILPRIFSALPMTAFNNPYLAALSSLPYAFKTKNGDNAEEGEEEPPSETVSSPPEAVAKNSTLSEGNAFDASLHKSSFQTKEKDSSNVDSDMNEDTEFSSSNCLQFKRKRIAFSAQQYELLQTTFEHNNFPEPADQQCIARQLKAPYRSIKMWFQNKRANARKKLLPGEKGSGRAVNGDKIPGDTDTRFYCDQCPAAFICQKYLNNHYDAHKQFVTKCPKCSIIFTHEYLLKTHILSKCGKNKSKNTSDDFDSEYSFKKIKRDEDFSESSAAPENTLNIKKEPIPDKELDTEQMSRGVFSPALLTQLNSTLPLLTLLQMQKKPLQSQDLHEQPTIDKDETEQNSEDEQKVDLDSNIETFSVPEKDYKGADNGVKKHANMKNIPPLIPSVLIPSCSDASRFAILRHLLTNFHHKQSGKEKSDDIENASNSVGEHDEANQSDGPNSEDCSMDEDDSVTDNVNLLTINCKPTKNIPPQLHHLFQNREESCHSKDDSENEEMQDLHNAPSPSCSELLSQVEYVADILEEGKSAEKRKLEQELNSKDGGSSLKMKGPKQKRLRRRTTVFTEAQHRILYLHFTHCNFPDPSMFRILSKLTSLNPHVIKIWFQNERSRQRRQVTSDSEVPREKKPYKCRDCGVEFAMPAFLVKHCLRHIPTDNVTSQAKKCPICMVEFDSQKLHSHFMASHNLSVNVEEEGGGEENICHLCEQHFSDLNSLSEHKYEHLKETKYGDPPQCFECKTTFVNVLCLESHMATHNKFKWDHVCQKCHLSFYDKILLESHMMSHSLSEKFNDTTHSHSEYLNSLIQHISDSKLKSIKPKQEDLNSTTANIPGIDILIKPNIKLEDKDSTNESAIGDKIACKESDYRQLKFVPVHFIPVTSPLPNGNSNLSTIFQSSNVAISSPPSSVNSSLNTPSEVRSTLLFENTSPNASLKENFFPVKSEKTQKLKQLPNLIPICDSSQIIDKNLNNSPAFFEREDAIQIEIKEEQEDTSDEKVDENEDSSHFLIYTPYASEYRKRRRTPTHFNASQRDILEAYYKYDNFPDPNEQLKLSEYLQVPYSVIKTWFQNTRKNHRKHLKESYKFEEGGPFECWDCRVCFVSKVYLDTHIRQHQEEQPYKCAICGQHFPHQAVYDIHLKIGCSKKMKKRYDHLKQASFPSPLCEPLKKSSNIGSSLEKGIIPSQLSECTKAHFKCKIDNSNSLNLKLVKMEPCVPLDQEESSPSKPLTSHCSISPHENGLKALSEDLDKTPIEGKGSESQDVATTVLSADKDDAIINQNERVNSLDSLIKHKDEVLCMNSMSPSQYTPKVLGYTCQDCSQTFSTFLSIAEHKENGDCPAKNNCSNSSPSPSLDHFASPNSPPTNQSETSVNGAAILNYSDNDGPTQQDNIATGKSNYNFKILQLHYDHSNFPSSTELGLIAKRLKIEREAVAHWFQKRRSKERKEKYIGYKAPQECLKCPSVFVHKEALIEHEESVHTSTAILIKFVCPEEGCQSAFPNATLLETHQLVHNDMLASKEAPNDLKSHFSFLETHYTENNFPSPMDVGFIARRLAVAPLGIHWWFKERRLKHMSMIEKLQEAPPDKKVEDSSSLELSALECRICDAAFLDSSSLEQHEQIHISNLSLICTECSLEFGNPLSLETHLLRHGISSSKETLASSKLLKIGPISEMKCNYLQLKVLYCHFKQCNLPKKEEIKLLSRRLRLPAKNINAWFKYQRQSHALKLFPEIKSGGGAHLNKKPTAEQISTCVVCAAEFVSAQCLGYHLRIHRLGYTFTCKDCGKYFAHEVLLDTHTLSHHSQTVKQAAKNLDRKLKNVLKEFISNFYDSFLGLKDSEEATCDNYSLPVSESAHAPESKAPSGGCHGSSVQEGREEFDEEEDFDDDDEEDKLIIDENLELVQQSK